MQVNYKQISIALALFLLAIVSYAYYLANSPPGNEKTVEEKRKDDPVIAPEVGPIERLHLDWDSEDPAVWPASEVLATLCEKAYLSPIEAKTAFGTLDFEKCTTIAADSNIGYVITSGDTCVIVFRGTDDPGDWIVNVDMRTDRTQHGSAHRGFYRAYSELKPQVDQILARDAPSRVWITGHSLGGALALACAYDLEENSDHKIVGLMTFGQPIFTKQDLAEYLDKQFLGRYAHFVNDADFVPRVPPTFSHCGSLVWFTENGIRRSEAKRPVFGAPKVGRLEESSAEIKPMSQREFEQFKADLQRKKTPKRGPNGEMIVEGNSPYIRDHSMGLYLQKIRRTLSGDGGDAKGPDKARPPPRPIGRMGASQ